jgi:hypothetical protein
MESLSRFGTELASWYWWLSVVLVGIAINLVSAYLKPPVDSWLARNSTKRRARRNSEKAKFEQEVRVLAANSTLLILENQKAVLAELKTIGIMVVVGIDLILYYVLSQVAQPQSTLLKVVAICIGATLPFMLGYLLICMQRENVITERVAAARERYRDGA